MSSCNYKNTFIDLARQSRGLPTKFIEKRWLPDKVLNNNNELLERVIFDEIISFYLTYKMPTTKDLFMKLYGKIQFNGTTISLPATQSVFKIFS